MNANHLRLQSAHHLQRRSHNISTRFLHDSNCSLNIVTNQYHSRAINALIHDRPTSPRVNATRLRQTNTLRILTNRPSHPSRPLNRPPHAHRQGITRRKHRRVNNYLSIDRNKNYRIQVLTQKSAKRIASAGRTTHVTTTHITRSSIITPASSHHSVPHPPNPHKNTLVTQFLTNNSIPKFFISLAHRCPRVTRLELLNRRLCMLGSPSIVIRIFRSRNHSAVGNHNLRDTGTLLNGKLLADRNRMRVHRHHLIRPTFRHSQVTNCTSSVIHLARRRLTT